MQKYKFYRKSDTKYMSNNGSKTNNAWRDPCVIYELFLNIKTWAIIFFFQKDWNSYRKCRFNIKKKFHKYPSHKMIRRTLYLREDWILRGPRSSSFWVPRNLSQKMVRQARIGDTALVKSREMTGRTQTLPWWLEEEEIKTIENKIHWFRCLKVLTDHSNWEVRLDSFDP